MVPHMQVLWDQRIEHPSSPCLPLPLVALDRVQVLPLPYCSYLGAGDSSACTCAGLL